MIGLYVYGQVPCTNMAKAREYCYYNGVCQANNPVLSVRQPVLILCRHKRQPLVPYTQCQPKLGTPRSIPKQAIVPDHHFSNKVVIVVFHHPI